MAGHETTIEILPNPPIPTPAEARALLAMCLDSKEQTGQVLSLVRVLLRHRCRQEALERLKRLSQSVPQHPDILQALVETALPVEPGLALAACKSLLRLENSRSNRLLHIRTLALNGELQAAGALLDELKLEFPQDPEILSELAVLSVRNGDFDAGLLQIEEALRLAPGHTWATAFKYGLLLQLGRLEEASEFQALDAMVEIHEDFLDQKACREVTSAVLAHRDLVASHEISTRGGSHTTELSETRGPVAMRELLKRLRLLLPSKTKLWETNSQPETSLYLQAWAVILGEKAYQESHIHPSGLLSGVLYLQVPEQEGEAGMLEFGRPSLELFGNVDCPVKLVAPRPGRLVLFPSSFYHRTVPTTSRSKRVSLAFDLCPH